MIAIAHNFIGHIYSTLGLIVICIYIFNILAQFDEFNLIINLRYLKKIIKRI
jgi:exosortase/archaeosortase